MPAFSIPEATAPEKRLLLCCARTRMRPEIAEEIRAILRGPLNFDLLLDAATQNAILPLLGRQLPAVAADLLSDTHAKKLKDATHSSAVRGLALTAELLALAKSFRAAELEGIPYKGPVLAAQAYGDVTLREYEDIDIILRQRDMARADEIMLAAGYQPKFAWILSPNVSASLIPGEYNYRDERRGMMVELHTERTLRHFPVAPDLDDLARRLVSVSLNGHAVQTFAPEDTLPLLCVHGCKDFWERLSWVVDIAELVQAVALDWDQVFRCADSWRAGRMVHIGLALADGLFVPPLPEEVRARIRRDGAAMSLASEVAQTLLAGEESARGGSERFRFRRRSVEGLLAGWCYSMRLAVAPAEEDWEMTQLSGRLAPLYVALRPFRLLRKYGR